jgi:hypothetical protein
MGNKYVVNLRQFGNGQVADPRPGIDQDVIVDQ